MADGKEHECDETAPTTGRVETWEPEFDETYNSRDQEVPAQPAEGEGDDHGA